MPKKSSATDMSVTDMSVTDMSVIDRRVTDITKTEEFALASNLAWELLGHSQSTYDLTTKEQDAIQELFRCIYTYEAAKQKIFPTIPGEKWPKVTHKMIYDLSMAYVRLLDFYEGNRENFPNISIAVPIGDECSFIPFDEAVEELIEKLRKEDELSVEFLADCNALWSVNCPERGDIRDIWDLDRDRKYPLNRDDSRYDYNPPLPYPFYKKAEYDEVEYDEVEYDDIDSPDTETDGILNMQVARKMYAEAKNRLLAESAKAEQQKKTGTVVSEIVDVPSNAGSKVREQVSNFFCDKDNQNTAPNPVRKEHKCGEKPDTAAKKESKMRLVKNVNKKRNLPREKQSKNATIQKAGQNRNGVIPLQTKLVYANVDQRKKITTGSTVVRTVVKDRKNEVLKRDFVTQPNSIIYPKINKDGILGRSRISIPYQSNQKNLQNRHGNGKIIQTSVNPKGSFPTKQGANRPVLESIPEDPEVMRYAPLKENRPKVKNTRNAKERPNAITKIKRNTLLNLSINGIWKVRKGVPKRINRKDANAQMKNQARQGMQTQVINGVKNVSNLSLSKGELRPLTKRSYNARINALKCGKKTGAINQKTNQTKRENPIYNNQPQKEILEKSSVVKSRKDKRLKQSLPLAQGKGSSSKMSTLICEKYDTAAIFCNPRRTKLQRGCNATVQMRAKPKFH